MNWSVWITFWVFLLFDVLLATPLVRKLRLEQNTSDFEYEALKTIKCRNDSTFYSPTDVKSECVTAAMNCIFLEFSHVVQNECEDPDYIMDSTVELLEIIQNNVKAIYVHSSANNCACEKWSQTPYSEFLENIKNLFAQLNSQ